MRAKKQFLRKKADKRLRRFQLFIQILLVLMWLVVLFDSFQHDLPFYYILFLFAGAVVGRIYKYTHRVELEQRNLDISLRTSRWNLVLLALVITMRFFLGKTILESFNVIWTGDAIYLFFVGVYHSRWKDIMRQIDEIYYKLIIKSHD